MRRRLCIVDDDEMLSMMLEDHLSSHEDLSVQSYATGEDFLNDIDNRPDLVILDFNLDSIQPEAKNGLEVLEDIKAHDPTIQVIMYSSEQQKGKAFDYIQAQTLEFILKDNDAFSKIDLLISQAS